MRLKDWVKTAAQYAGIVIAASLAYGLLMSVTADSAEDVVTMAAIYLVMFGAFMGMGFHISVYKVNLPLAIGFGSTRKEAFVGMQCYRLCFMGLLAGGAAGLYLLCAEADRESMAELAPIGLGLMICMDILGSVIGMVTTKFSKSVVVAISIIAGLLICGAVVGIVILCVAFADTMEKFNMLTLWVVPAVSLVLYALILIPEHKTIYKYNVKL